nr:diadenylate cyclase [Haladaptatus halobius]
MHCRWTTRTANAYLSPRLNTANSSEISQIHKDMLKEFSRLDGAFVISDAGKIVSAYRYLEPSIDDLDIPKGLGTRHNAAAAITGETDAVTIVLSEGDSRVRGFKNGDLVFNIDPDQY